MLSKMIYFPHPDPASYLLKFLALTSTKCWPSNKFSKTYTKSCALRKFGRFELTQKYNVKALEIFHSATDLEYYSPLFFGVERVQRLEDANYFILRALLEVPGELPYKRTEPPGQVVLQYSSFH